MPKEILVLSIGFAFVLILFFGGAFWSASNTRAKINQCEDLGGVWHQSNCMKAEYFHDLEKK